MPSTKLKTPHTIRRTRKRRRDECSSAIENKLIDNPLLKAADKWLLIYLESHPSDWEPSIQDIVNHCADGPDAVKAMMKRLKEAGHMQTYRVVDAKGRVVRWTTEYSSVPVEGFGVKHKTIKLSDDQEPEDQEPQEPSPEVEIPEVDSPQVDNPPHTNKDLNNSLSESKNLQAEGQKQEPISPPIDPFVAQQKSSTVKNEIYPSGQWNESLLSEWAKFWERCDRNPGVNLVNLKAFIRKRFNPYHEGHEDFLEEFAIVKDRYLRNRPDPSTVSQIDQAPQFLPRSVAMSVPVRVQCS